MPSCRTAFAIVLFDPIPKPRPYFVNSAIAEDVRAGRLAPESIDEAAFEKRLWSGALPPLDLCIRTSGELRVSNFLPWQMAYAEIVVTDELWPDFREATFYAALLAYQQRERRFGQTGTQIRKS